MAMAETELAALIAQGQPSEIIGSGTKKALGRPTQSNSILDMSAFKGVSLYEPDELVLEAGAGTSLAEIENLLAKNNQQLAFEPPDYAKLLGSNNNGTLGGLIACGLSGPRRIKAGAARDHILGFSGVSGRGEIFKAGGRVVKNVTGFDLAKLMVGSYGTLVALTRITMKVLPAAETEETLVLNGLDDGRAIRAMSLAMQSSCEVSGAAHLPGQQTLLRLEGIGPSVIYRRDKLAGLLKEFGTVDLLPNKKSRAQWIAVRDVHALCNEPKRCVWKLSVTPSEGADIVARISRHTDTKYFFDWAGGLIWLSVPASDDASASVIRGSFDSGHATLVRAPEAVRARVDVFQTQPAPLATLSSRVKTSFDPTGVLNFGRMYRDR